MRPSHDAYLSKLITDSEETTSFINSKKFWSFVKKLSNGKHLLKVDSKVIIDSTILFKVHSQLASTPMACHLYLESKKLATAD